MRRIGVCKRCKGAVFTATWKGNSVINCETCGEEYHRYLVILHYWRLPDRRESTLEAIRESAKLHGIEIETRYHRQWGACVELLTDDPWLREWADELIQNAEVGLAPENSYPTLPAEY